MLSEVARLGDTDYAPERMVKRANENLVNNIGNLVNRTVSMVNRYRDGCIPRTGLKNDGAHTPYVSPGLRQQ